MIEQSSGSVRLRRLGAVACFGLALALIAGLIGYQVGTATPTDDSAEAGFARDMQTHHAQAVQLSLLVRDRTDDEEIRLLALDILTSQQQQIGQMYAWLTLWGLPQTGKEPPMDWMEHSIQHEKSAMTRDSEVTAMPGMASQADLEALTAAQGKDAEIRFLNLMIAHHQGGVAMAAAVVDLTDEPQVLSLARAIEASQEFEIEQMRKLLETRTGG